MDSLINNIGDIAPNAVEKNREKLMTLLDAGYWEDKLDQLLNYIPTLITAIIVLYLGFKVANILVRIYKKFGQKKGLDPAVINFTKSIIEVLLKIFVFLTTIQILGFKAASLVAIFGAASLAIGLALQGTLQNFAGGVVILVLKPFKLDDVIEVNGHKGVVREIRIFNTVLEKVLTNEMVIIPNSSISSNTIVNWTNESNRRVDAAFSVAYGTNIELVRSVVLKIADNDDRLLNDTNPPSVIVTSLGDSSVNMELRVWVKPENYFAVLAEMIEKVYNELNANNIEIPFPQLDVKIKNRE